MMSQRTQELRRWELTFALMGAATAVFLVALVVLYGMDVRVLCGLGLYGCIAMARDTCGLAAVRSRAVDEGRL